MQLTPEQIESRDFSPELKGFDPAEVRAFLSVVAADLRDVSRGGAPRLAPEEIKGRTFATQLRGLSTEEVTEFLAMVATTYPTSAVRETESVERPPLAPARPSDGDSFERFGAELADVMRAATQRAERIVADSERDAATMRRGVEQECAALRASAEREISEKLREAEARLADLRAVEQDLLARFADAETMLQKALVRVPSPSRRPGSVTATEARP